MCKRQIRCIRNSKRFPFIFFRSKTSNESRAQRDSNCHVHKYAHQCTRLRDGDSKYVKSATNTVTVKLNKFSLATMWVQVKICHTVARFWHFSNRNRNDCHNRDTHLIKTHSLCVRNHSKKRKGREGEREERERAKEGNH